MNKILTFVAALALIFTVNTAVAQNNNKAVSILTKQVDRALMQELKLNEMEYIKLKDLNKSYQQEVEGTKNFYAGNAELTETKIAELNNRYQAELTKVLTFSQIEGFGLAQAMACNN